MPNLCPFKFTQLGRGQLIALHEGKQRLTDQTALQCEGEDCQIFIGTSRGPDGRLLGSCGITHGAVQATYGTDFLRATHNLIGRAFNLALFVAKGLLKEAGWGSLHDEKIWPPFFATGAPPPPRGKESMPGSGTPKIEPKTN